MATLKKTAKRHARPKELKATSLLLLYVINKHGGIREVARLTGHSPQLINLWIQKGEVPLKFVGRIANILDEPTWVFNYEGVVTLREIAPFKVEVNIYDMPSANKKLILTSAQPRDIKKLLE